VRKPRAAIPKSSSTEQGILPSRDATKPPTPHKADVVAIQALAAGLANQDQQKRALRFIVHGLCAAYDWPYRPGDVEATHVMLGRQFVGQQIVYLVNANVGAMTVQGGNNGNGPAERR
jgi:hypothetical protein